MMRRLVRLVVVLGLACVIGAGLGSSVVGAAEVGVAEPGPTVDVVGPTPSVDGCGCDDLVDLIVFILKRYGVPLPTLPPPPGVPYL